MKKASQPVPSFQRSNGPSLSELPVSDPAVPRLELAEWAERYGVVAGITLRPMSLGLWTEEPVGQVMRRWRVFRNAFAGRFPTIVLSHQVHGSAVRWHEALPEGWLILDAIDGHATAEPGVLLTITVADCIPVYLVVPRQGAVALVHAGWRGAAGGILAHALEALKSRAGVAGTDIVMHCGVGICGECYEVGAEVAARFQLAAGSIPVQLDLRAILARQAHELGIADVSVSPWCAAEDRERFFSHRASGGRDGRMVAYLGRPIG